MQKGLRVQDLGKINILPKGHIGILVLYIFGGGSEASSRFAGHIGVLTRLDD